MPRLIWTAVAAYRTAFSAAHLVKNGWPIHAKRKLA
jgi:hypothetical protein